MPHDSVAMASAQIINLLWLERVRATARRGCARQSNIFAQHLTDDGPRSGMLSRGRGRTLWRRAGV